MNLHFRWTVTHNTERNYILVFQTSFLLPIAASSQKGELPAGTIQSSSADIFRM